MDRTASKRLENKITGIAGTCDSLTILDWIAAIDIKRGVFPVREDYLLTSISLLVVQYLT